MPDSEALKALLHASCQIAIVAHHNPDADALGSSLALARFLSKQGHQVEVLMPSAFPDFLDWMPGAEKVVAYSEESQTYCRQVFQAVDLVFCMDFSSYARLQFLEPLLRVATARRFIIDHHQAPDMEADFWLWNVQASSTSELVFELLELLEAKSFLDIEMGECIYAGIVTDTSSFKHPSTTERVHLIAAELMALGVNTNRVQRFIYDNNSENRLRFIGYALHEKLKVLPQYRTAYFVITKEELRMYENKLGDTEGLVNYALSIADIVLAVIIIENEDCVKMSFRSVGNFAVNEFARKHFSGGGHKNAAGSDCMTDAFETEQLLLSLLPQYENELHHSDA
ncbi:MAG: bifunctional oligoribonuclease/PAP phosphatase NrnA [Microscillaceae bacterium]|nr:bifunctional oligoribonuclease/PAP phosphatase NrnA [Microscillaceae bacterium]